MFVLYLCAEGDHSEVDVPKAAHQPVPGDGQVPAGADRSGSHRLWGHQVRETSREPDFTLLLLLYIWMDSNPVRLDCSLDVFGDSVPSDLTAQCVSDFSATQCFMSCLSILLCNSSPLKGFSHSLRHLVVVLCNCRPHSGLFNPFFFMEKHPEREQSHSEWHTPCSEKSVGLFGLINVLILRLSNWQKTCG